MMNTNYYDSCYREVKSDGCIAVFSCENRYYRSIATPKEIEKCFQDVSRMTFAKYFQVSHGFKMSLGLLHVATLPCHQQWDPRSRRTKAPFSNPGLLERPSIFFPRRSNVFVGEKKWLKKCCQCFRIVVLYI